MAPPIEKQKKAKEVALLFGLGFFLFNEKREKKEKKKICVLLFLFGVCVFAYIMVSAGKRVAFNDDISFVTTGEASLKSVCVCFLAFHCVQYFCLLVCHQENV